MTTKRTNVNTSTLLCELLNGGSLSFTANVLASVPNQKEEEEETSRKGPSKIASARQLFQALISRPDASRQNIIQQFEDKVNVTHSTAVSYYERLAKEAGLTGKSNDDNYDSVGGNATQETAAGGIGSAEQGIGDGDTESEQLDIGDDVERVGVIRTVKNAHLIYKQQTETGAFDELWIYNIGKGKDELDIKRAILAGTDIPPKKTKSPDGSQTFNITTIGNAQYLHITGMQN